MHLTKETDCSTHLGCFSTYLDPIAVQKLIKTRLIDHVTAKRVGSIMVCLFCSLRIGVQIFNFSSHIVEMILFYSTLVTELETCHIYNSCLRCVKYLFNPIFYFILSKKLSASALFSVKYINKEKSLKTLLL